jgi:hypothetical protein
MQARTELAAIRAPCEYLLGRPARARRLARRDAADNGAAKRSLDAFGSSLYWLLLLPDTRAARARARGRVKCVSELREAVEAPAEDLAGAAEHERVVLAERGGEEGLGGEARERRERVLRVRGPAEAAARAEAARAHVRATLGGEHDRVQLGERDRAYAERDEARGERGAVGGAGGGRGAEDDVLGEGAVV